MSQDSHTETNSLPIACSLTDTALAERQKQLILALFNVIQQVQELADGYAFQFASDRNTVARLTEFISVERECCPFFAFELIFEPNRGPLWLRLRGGAGVKEFIQTLIK
ncbi:MAG: hypothetical protein M3Z04_03495 [Chloroflexota bacterium]|nr:hypothetical protein [Chloroflexota bacterium]